MNQFYYINEDNNLYVDKFYYINKSNTKNYIIETWGTGTVVKEVAETGGKKLVGEGLQTGVNMLAQEGATDILAGVAGAGARNVDQLGYKSAGDTISSIRGGAGGATTTVEKTTAEVAANAGASGAKGADNAVSAGKAGANAGKEAGEAGAKTVVKTEAEIATEAAEAAGKTTGKKTGKQTAKDAAEWVANNPIKATLATGLVALGIGTAWLGLDSAVASVKKNDMPFQIILIKLTSTPNIYNINFINDQNIEIFKKDKIQLETINTEFEINKIIDMTNLEIIVNDKSLNGDISNIKIMKLKTSVANQFSGKGDKGFDDLLGGLKNSILDFLGSLTGLSADTIKIIFYCILALIPIIIIYNIVRLFI